MKRKSKKIIQLILMYILLIVCLSQSVFADWEPRINKIASGEVGNASIMATDIFGSIINATQIIGIGIGVIVLVFVGIQYIVASPTEKAEIKNKTTNFIIGSVLMISSAAIIQIVKMFLEANAKF